MVPDRAGVKTKSPALGPLCQLGCHIFNADEPGENVPSWVFSSPPLKGSKTSRWPPSSTAPLVWVPSRGALAVSTPTHTHCSTEGVN